MKLRAVNGLFDRGTSLEDAISFCNSQGGSLSIHMSNERGESMSLAAILKKIAGDSIIDVWTPEFVMGHGDCSEEVAIEALKLMQEEYDLERGYNLKVMYEAVNQCNTPKAVTKRYLASLGISLDVLLTDVKRVTADELCSMIKARKSFKTQTGKSTYSSLLTVLDREGVCIVQSSCKDLNWLVLKDIDYRAIPCTNLEAPELQEIELI